MQIIRLSSRVVLGISVLFISILSVQEINIESTINLNDKFLHFGCFAYLTVIFWLSRIINKEFWVYAIVLGYGILIEIIQIYLPYRSFEFLDIFADFLGILAGNFLIFFLKDLYPKY